MLARHWPGCWQPPACRRRRQFYLRPQTRGVQYTIQEDAWGDGITSSSIAHLAASPALEILRNGTDLQNDNRNNPTIGAPIVKNGSMTVPDRPGLGVEPDFDALGDPLSISPP